MSRADSPSPLVSVLMPVWNGAALIGETIESLLAQTLQDFELIVVDDCSTDGTLELLAGYDDRRIRIIASPENRGPGHARNLAFATARGRYIAALDHDDLCRPDRLARQVAYLEQHPDVVLVASAASTLRDGRTRYALALRHTSPALLDWLLLTRNPLVWSSVMFRADAARALSPFMRTDRLYAEDFDLYHRLRPYGRIARIDADLLTYREHGEGMSKRHVEIMTGHASTILAEAYGPIFGEGAHHRAALMIRHAGLCEPVRDVATLDELSAVIVALHRHFVATRTLATADRRLVDAAVSRLWSQFAQGVLASGAARLRQVARGAPPGIRWSRAQPFHLLRARLRRRRIA